MRDVLNKVAALVLVSGLTWLVASSLVVCSTTYASVHAIVSSGGVK